MLMNFSKTIFLFLILVVGYLLTLFYYDVGG